MGSLSKWVEVFFESFQSFGEKFMGTLPNIIGAIVILLLGWLFARLVAKGIQKVLKTLRFDVMANKIKATEMLEKANIKNTPSELVGKFAYWVILLVVWITATETLGWNAVSEEISKLISYLPTLFSAILFFILGVYVSTFVRDIIHGATSSLGISAGKMLGTVVFYLLLVIVTLTALNQAGIDTSIITSNMLIIIGSVMAAGAISYGFASRTALANILAVYLTKRNFQLGQVIVIDNIEGKIVGITNLSIIIESKDGDQIMIPANDLLSKTIRIKKAIS